MTNVTALHPAPDTFETEEFTESGSGLFETCRWHKHPPPEVLLRFGETYRLTEVRERDFGGGSTREVAVYVREEI